MDGFDIKRCGRDDYPEFLDVLNRAFGYEPDSHWFQRNLVNCTPYPDKADSRLIGCHVIAVNRENGEIMGGVGVYPFQLIVSEDAPDGERFVLPAVGIGQVCCLPQYRERGVMSGTLNKAIEESVRDGYVLGFLGGDRYRYGNFGFDYGGGALQLNYRFNRLKTAVNQAYNRGADVRTAGFEDIKFLNGMYETLPSYVKRDAGYWQTQIGGGKFIWQIGTAGGAGAYIAYEAAQKNRILEICGDPDLALFLIYSHMKMNWLDRASTELPFAPGRADPLYRKLSDASSHMSASPMDNGLTAIFSPDGAYGILKPAIERMGIRLADGAEKGIMQADGADKGIKQADGAKKGIMQADGAEKGIMQADDADKGTKQADDAEKAELIRCLLGCPGFPRGRAYKGARPLVMWASSVDNV